jgi:hypothetical protein
MESDPIEGLIENFWGRIFIAANAEQPPQKKYL